MKQNSLLLACLLILGTTLVISCSKTGPAGATGPQGPAGPAGPTGAAGPTGTANVIYSAWLDVTYTRGTGADSIYYFASIPATKLDANMLSRGEIKVYMNWSLPTTPDVTPLPYYDGGLLINVDFYVGRIDLYANANLSTNTTKQGQVRYVLIPGGTTASIKGIDWKDYNAVQAALQIKN